MPRTSAQIVCISMASSDGLDTFPGGMVVPVEHYMGMEVRFPIRSFRRYEADVWDDDSPRCGAPAFNSRLGCARRERAAACYGAYAGLRGMGGGIDPVCVWVVLRLEGRDIRASSREDAFLVRSGSYAL